MKKYFILLFALLLFNVSCFPVYATQKYCPEVQDLPSSKKAIANTIWKKILANKKKKGVIEIENAVLCNDKTFDECIDALTQTYFPYKGELEVTSLIFDYTDHKDVPMCTFSCNPSEIYKTYQLNKKQNAKVKAWTKKAIKKAKTPKQKVIAIGKFCAQKTHYVSGMSDAYTIIKQGKGNCKAMARLHKAMCKFAGIKSCRICRGYTDGDPDNAHAWNTMVIGKKRIFSDSCYFDGNHKESYLYMSPINKRYTIRIFN